jgi:hypothetical protein
VSDRNDTARERVAASVAELRTLAATAEVAIEGLRGGTLSGDTIASSTDALSKIVNRCRRLLGEIRLFSPDEMPLTEVDQHIDANLRIAEAIKLTIDLSTSARAAKKQLERAAGAGAGAELYIAGEEDTLQRIAARFYGTHALWTRIAEANGVTSVAPGDLLVIPNARSVAA